MSSFVVWQSRKVGHFDGMLILGLMFSQKNTEMLQFRRHPQNQVFIRKQGFWTKTMSVHSSPALALKLRTVDGRIRSRVDVFSNKNVVVWIYPQLLLSSEGKASCEGSLTWSDFWQQTQAVWEESIEGGWGAHITWTTWVKKKTLHPFLFLK